MITQLKATRVLGDVELENRCKECSNNIMNVNWM
jgi:hypothetical protein